MKKKRLILSLLFIVTCFSRVCADEVHYFYVDVGDSPVYFALADHPVITYENDELVVTCSEQVISLPVAEIRSAGFATSTGILTPPEDRPRVSGGVAYFCSLRPGSQIFVFTTDGKRVSQILVSANGMATLDISHLPKGVLIIKSEKHHIKINNK